MREKLPAVILVFVLLAGGSLYASPQKVYGREDAEFMSVRNLALEAGVLYPIYTPATAAELMETLGRIPEDMRGAQWKEVYDSIASPPHLITAGPSTIDLAAIVFLEGYFRPNSLPARFQIDYKDIPPMLNLQGEVSVFDHSYLFLDFIEKDLHIDNPHSNFETVFDFGTMQFRFLGTQGYMPFKAGLSAGGAGFNLQVGRNRQYLGRGVTGDFIIGDNLVMQQYLELSWRTEYFNYHMNLTHFDQQSGPYGFESFRFSGNHQQRMSHAFEITPLRNFSFTINLAAMFETDSAFDIRMLNPMMYVHDFNNMSNSVVIYPGDEANNAAAFELTWAFLPGWKATASLILDQIQLSYESEVLPNAYGALLNFENSTALGDGYLHSYIEGVYTSPYLYLNHKTDAAGVENYNYDWIVGYYMGNSPDFSYAGYTYGPDSIVIAIGSEYTARQWSLSGEFLYRVHGNHGLYTDNPTTSDFTKSSQKVTPTGDYPEHLFRFKVAGHYELLKHLELKASCSLNWLINENNAPGNAFYPTGTFGVTYALKK